MTLQTTPPTFALKVLETLKTEFPENTSINIAAGETGRLFIRIVSDKFSGLDDDEVQDRIWSFLRQTFGSEAQQIALVVALSIDQL